MAENRRSVVHVDISGRVQGVGFRAFVAQAAEVRGLTGWVRNRRDGRVEAVFAGPLEDVAAAIQRCRVGPRVSRVDVVDQRDAADEGWTKFSVLATI